MSTLSVVCTVSALAVGAAMPARAAEAVSQADRAFVAMVSQGGMFEVAAGAIAASQGNTEDIKDQGTTEEHDHELVGGKLKAIAEKAGIAVQPKLNQQFERQVDELKSLSGPAFDAAYLREMADIHAKDGAAFAKEAESGTNPQLKSFAAQTHRIVLRHIGEIKAVGPASK